MEPGASAFQQRPRRPARSLILQIATARPAPAGGDREKFPGEMAAVEGLDGTSKALRNTHGILFREQTSYAAGLIATGLHWPKTPKQYASRRSPEASSRRRGPGVASCAAKRQQVEHERAPAGRAGGDEYGLTLGGGRRSASRWWRSGTKKVTVPSPMRSRHQQWNCTSCFTTTVPKPVPSGARSQLATPLTQCARQVRSTSRGSSQPARCPPDDGSSFQQRVEGSSDRRRPPAASVGEVGCLVAVQTPCLRAADDSTPTFLDIRRAGEQRCHGQLRAAFGDRMAV